MSFNAKCKIRCVQKRIPGVNGINGLAGLSGINGVPGAPGTAGSPGSPGLPGPSTDVFQVTTSGEVGDLFLGGPNRWSIPLTDVQQNTDFASETRIPRLPGVGSVRYYTLGMLLLPGFYRGTFTLQLL